MNVSSEGLWALRSQNLLKSMNYMKQFEWKHKSDSNLSYLIFMQLQQQIGCNNNPPDCTFSFHYSAYKT